MAGKDKKLSVITICYNIKDEIERTCESIVNQTNQNFEWIVVDGGSTDGTVEILNKYKDRIDVFISEPDNGIYSAMNKGIKQAHGEFLNFMNGGDCFAVNTVVADFLNYDTDGVDVLYGNMNIVEDSGIRRLQTYPETINKIFFVKDCIGHQAAFIRHNLFEKYGLYNEKYRIVSDWERWIVFIENGCSFRYWDYVAADFYRGGVGSKMSKKHNKERDDVIKAHFTKDETSLAEKMAYNYRFIKLFNILPLLCIKTKKNGNQWAVSLFDILPLYKIHSKNGRSKHYLFGILPWLKGKLK